MGNLPRFRQGLLLLNLGTPDAPDSAAVRRYLAEFLMDPLVVDIAVPLRFLLVYGMILPKRPQASAEAYRKIWDVRGSPLAFHLEDLAAKVSRNLNERKTHVYTAMRYGNPSIASALEKAHREGIDELTVFPLYPQYSLSATESSIQKVKAEAKRLKYEGKLRFVPPFFDHPSFIRNFARRIQEATAGFDPQFHLFSFHGLPERHMRKVDRSGDHCLSCESCCGQIVEANRDCYRAQCFASAFAIARGIGLMPHQFGSEFAISFQSRLGRTPWIRPYTDHLIPELPRKGIKRLAVICPSFVSDCLETLEEIGIRARESFRSAGGEELLLVPSLNSSDDWSMSVCELMETAG